MSSAAPIDLARALDEGAWTGAHKRVVALAALAFAVDGFANQVLGVAIPSLSKEWGVTRDAFAPVFALGLIGLAIGTIIGGMLGDRIGRRPTLIGAILLFGAATALVSLSDGVGSLAAIRLIDGLGLGAAIPNATSLVAEFTPSKKRSFAIAISFIFIPVGGILSGSAAALLLPVQGWPALFLTAGACAFAVAALLVVTLPESPRYLLRRPERVAQLRTVARRLGIEADDHCTFLPDASGRTLSAPIALLFAGGARRDTLALWTAFFLCLLSTYSVQSWGPSAFTAAGIGIRQVGALMAGFGFGGILGGVIAGFTIGRIGSRATVGIFAVAASGVSVLIATGIPGFSVLMVEAVLLGVSLSGLQSPLYALAAHMYAPQCRATGVGMASAAGRLGAMTSSFTGVFALNAGGTPGFFTSMAVAAALCFAAILLIRNQIAPGSSG